MKSSHIPNKNVPFRILLAGTQAVENNVKRHNFSKCNIGETEHTFKV
jgi:hypothetical protein